MRFFTLLLTLFSFSLMAGLPPTTLTGEQSATNTTTFNFKTPNYQATQTSGTNSRIETGNTNILINPSFEHSSFNTGWTNASGSVSVDTTNFTDGKKAMQISSSAIGTDVYQISTLNAANLKGQQMVASMDVKTADPLTQVCAVIDSVDTNCVTVPITSTTIPFRNVVIPFIGGGTNNGIRLKSATTTSSLITTIDNAKVGQGLPLQNVSGARLIDQVKITGCASPHNTTATTIGTLGTQTGCSYTSLLGNCSAPSTNIMGIKCNSLGAGTISVQYEGLLNQTSSAKAAYYKFYDGSSYANEASQVYGPATISAPSINQILNYTTTKNNVTLELQGYTDSGGAAYAFGTTLNPGTIKVWYFPPESRIYSTASQDTDWQPCTFSTLAWQGLGTVTNNLYCKRSGRSLKMRGYFTTGTTTTSTAQIPLPSNYGTITTGEFGVYDSFGFIIRNTSVNNVFNIIPVSNASYFNVSREITTNTYNPLTPATGSIAFGTGENIVFQNVEIPIKEWKDYGVIVGSFAGIEKCANDYECTDTFSAQVSSAGVVSGENLEWINGNASIANTSEYTITFQGYLKDGVNPLSSVMNCDATSTETANANNNIQISAQSSNSITVKTGAGGVLTARPFTIKCQKGTNDYKPKTAKVATSIGVPVVPGITTTGTGNSIDTFSVSYGTTNATTVCSASPCSYLDQIGNAVSSITRTAANNYSLNLSKTYAKLKCSASVYNGANGGIIANFSNGGGCLNCNSMAFSTSTTSNYYDTFGTLYCQGSY